MLKEKVPQKGTREKDNLYNSKREENIVLNKTSTKEQGTTLSEILTLISNEIH